MPHLVVDITGHGFGHAGQTAPVVEVLRRRRPELRLTIRTAVPPSQLAQLFAPGFATAPPPPDIGLAMHSPIRVDRVSSLAWYERLHASWDAVVDVEASTLERLAPDLTLSNIGFIGLAAAARCGIPSVAMSSLNWADIVDHYAAAPPAMIAAMRRAYGSATAFVLLTPHMPTSWATERVSVGPVGRLGRARRSEVAAKLGVDPAKRWVVVSFGGIPMGDLLAELPAMPDVEWLVDIAHLPGTRSIKDLGLPFIDLVASADLVLTKTGYGLFVEPAAHGVPVIYKARPDWPESPFLEGWIREVGAGAPLPATSEGLASLVRQARPTRPVSLEEGARAAADVLERRLYGEAARRAGAVPLRPSAVGR